MDLQLIWKSLQELGRGFFRIGAITHRERPGVLSSIWMPAGMGLEFGSTKTPVMRKPDYVLKDQELLPPSFLREDCGPVPLPSDRFKDRRSCCLTTPRPPPLLSRRFIATADLPRSPILILSTTFPLAATPFPSPLLPGISSNRPSATTEPIATPPPASTTTPAARSRGRAQTVAPGRLTFLPEATPI